MLKCQAQPKGRQSEKRVTSDHVARCWMIRYNTNHVCMMTCRRFDAAPLPWVQFNRTPDLQEKYVTGLILSSASLSEKYITLIYSSETRLKVDIFRDG